MYIPKDKWSRKAVEEGYRARSVYKLKELDERFRLLKKGLTVLDLGAAPGSWLQYVSEKVGSTGKVIGIDLQEIEPVADNVRTLVGDITDYSVDIILSDLAPKTSGIKDVDQWRSLELSASVLEIAEQLLQKNGICVLKILRGADFDEFLQEVRKKWILLRATSVKASRNSSREIYVILQLKVTTPYNE
jgi:23S rRNA (uridine2552-2'-O)-methyltransferase